MPIMFDYAVKYHGKYYPANTPIEEKPAQKAEEAGQGAEDVKAEEMPEAEAKPAQKAAKSRKKGDA